MTTFSELQSNPRLKKIFDDRIQVVRLIREWFWGQDFLEVNTMAGVASADQEPHLSPIAVTYHDEANQARPYFLQTSPEYAMKKLLAAGYEKIFQICPCWRDYEESGRTHNTEFTMIEWYRAPGKYEQVMEDIEKLFQFVGEKMKKKIVEFDGVATNIALPFERVPVRDLWQKYVEVNLDEYLDVNKLRELVVDLGYTASASDDFNDLFYKIFLNKIERHLGGERATIVSEYPIQMAALARPCAHDSRYSERFELYVCGLELANAFGELTDSEAQARRFEAEKIERIRAGKVSIPIDKELINALKSLSSASGIALGVDRMAMLFSGAKNINEVMFGTVRDQIDIRN
ncbi:MAG: EF-P lysine aminoacylase EpmA [Candidatus Magasanikbacteria bacterium]